MSNITLLNQDLPDFLQNAGVSELTRQLAGRTGVKRIVPKNGIFRKVVGGEEMGKVKGDLNVVVVNASPKVGRIFYAKQWSADAEPTAPDCFSNDGNVPDEGSANKQSDRCDSCEQNIKGSGMGNSKACRYSRRIAVVLEEDFGTSIAGSVYQMNLSSKSLFGDSVGDNTHPFESYTKYLSNNGKSLDYVVTQLSFNEDNDNQSILFTPTRFINKGEYAVTSKAAALPETQKMVVMTPYQADTSGRAPKLEAPKPLGEAFEKEDAKALAKVRAEAEDGEPIEVPKKRESKKTVEATPTSKKSLDSVVAAWTEEE
jgi:hypothetical protein